MACRKAFDVDLVACLLDAARPEWSEFREHYPRCPECAAEVRTWTELQASLAPSHPGAEDLARFEQRANDMAPEARKAIAAHIATCRSCRDELRALRAFDPRALAGAEAPASTRPRRWWRPVGRLVLHPASAFAYGMALALAVPYVAPELRPVVARALDDWRGSGPLVPPVEPAARLAASARPREGEAEAPTARGLDPGAGGGDLVARLDTVRVEPELPDAPIAPPAAARLAAKSAAAPAPAAQSAAVPATPPATREEAAADAEWPVVVLAPDREVTLRVPAHGLVLRLAPPRSQPALPAGLAWLRVRDAAGRRELREQQFGTPGSSAAIRVPATWLEPGRYRAAIVLGDDNRPVTVAQFRIEY